MIGIIDYGVGNLFSLSSSLRAIGEQVMVSGDKEILSAADKLLLPGVGAFADARSKLKEGGLDEFVCRQAEGGKPLLGICLGMQLLFDESLEYGHHPGLSLIGGRVVPFSLPKDYKIPHIGWNALHFRKPSPLLKYIKEGDHVYFVHSYHAVGCEEHVVADCEYGCPVTAIVQRDNIFGCQFHPEKSGRVGLAILKAFAEL